MTLHDNRDEDLGIIDQVDDLNEEVKSLALNLAIYLAKVKTKSSEINQMEPDFIRLVNGTVKVVQELAVIINAARNKETMVYQVPSGSLSPDHIETKLHSILEQCQRIMEALAGKTDIKI